MAKVDEMSVMGVPNQGLPARLATWLRTLGNKSGSNSIIGPMWAFVIVAILGGSTILVVRDIRFTELADSARKQIVLIETARYIDQKDKTTDAGGYFHPTPASMPVRKSPPVHRATSTGGYRVFSRTAGAGRLLAPQGMKDHNLFESLTKPPYQSVIATETTLAGPALTYASAIVLEERCQSCHVARNVMISADRRPGQITAIEILTIKGEWAIWAALGDLKFILAAVLLALLAMLVLLLRARGETVEAAKQLRVQQKDAADLQREYRIRTEEQQAAKEKAEAANKAKSQFLSIMSHELRTPLNAIIGFSETIADEPFGPLGHEKYNEYLGDVLNSGQHLLSLVNDLLDMSRVESGKMNLKNEQIEIETLISSVIRLMSPEARMHQVRLDARVSPGLGKVWGDERALRQVLINVVNNAVKFTDADGHVTITADESQSGSMLIQVVDTGCGIDPEKSKLVFETFEQGADGYARTHEGAGLGLSIAKALVEQHDGTISLESSPGIGTVVTLVLPPSRVLPDEDDDVTILDEEDLSDDPDFASVLVLEYAGVTKQFFKGSGEFIIGRNNQKKLTQTCDFVVDDRHVSRPHARIIYDAGSFYLVDESRLGTYVYFEDADPEFIHKNVSSPLTLCGWISLGAPLNENPDHQIAFERVLPDSNAHAGADDGDGSDDSLSARDVAPPASAA